MMIHKTHSKKELIDIVEFFHIPIDEYDELNKENLIIEIIKNIDRIPEIIPDYDFLLINNKDELKKYLSEANQDKTLSVKEKTKIMRKAKRIINYCKNGYDIYKSSFIDITELLDVANDIAEHGNIPTCRRSINMLNDDIKIPYKIEIKMTKKCKRELEIKKQLKLMNGGALQIKTGKYLINFD